MATLAAVAVGVWLVLWSCASPPAQRVGSPGRPAHAATPSVGPGLSLKELAQGANAEGEVRVAWNGPLNEDWRQRFETAYDREFDVKVALKAPAGQPADVTLGDGIEYAGLFRQGRLGSYPWSALFGAPTAAVLFDGGALAFAQQIVRPAYSDRQTSPVGASEAGCSAPAASSGSAACPLATWQALLDPRLKGRLGVADSTAVWLTLSTVWGDDKTSQFLTALAAQQPAHGTVAELEQRLTRGSIDAIAAAPGALPAGARPADVQPIVLRSLLAGPIKGAAHPDAALLFAGFLATQEGQQLWQDYAGDSSSYVDGSPTERYIAGRPYTLLDGAALATDLTSRAARYAKILGY